ncbi:hypothetical protein FHS26_001766 [Rhizobium pisi]|uniref:IstB-like ATP-binding domain-containing protein n=1 Tax=Rhizobium pisi TaxID=574561 RepID=A0A7W5BJE2_9HYPH|nr:hypothetical protein [Rhizobium pisi]
MITSNLPFDEWTETLGSECLTGALLGRITHHVNILEMNRDSYRLVSRATKGRLTPVEKRSARMIPPVRLSPPGGIIRALSARLLRRSDDRRN